MTWNPLLALDHLLFPRVCHVCGTQLEDDERVCCAQCWSEMGGTGYERIARANSMTRRLECFLPVEAAFAGYVYTHEAPIRELIHDIKYHGCREAGVVIGRQLGYKAQTGGVDKLVDLVSGVPITARRRKWRGYNQSELLAEGFSEVTGVPFVPDVVVRSRFSVSQTRMAKLQRQRNVKNSFVPGPNVELAKGKTLLMMDDVFTTGSTMVNCLSPLLGMDIRFAVCTAVCVVRGS